MNNEKEYFAFISYKREDEKWAKWLQHKLEHYKLPSNLNGITDLPKEIRPIFRDQSELAGGVLADEINKALVNSKYLIVICSPRAAQSQWVGKEVQTFIDLGRTDKIIPFIIGGKARAINSEEECFPLALLNLPPEQELLGINIDEMGRDAAAVKVVAQMFGLRFDALWQRYEREKRRRRVFIVVAALLLASASVFVAIWFSILNKRISEQKEEITAQKEEIIKQNNDIQKKNENLLNDSVVMTAQQMELKNEVFNFKIQKASRYLSDNEPISAFCMLKGLMCDTDVLYDTDKLTYVLLYREAVRQLDRIPLFLFRIDSVDSAFPDEFREENEEVLSPDSTIMAFFDSDNDNDELVVTVANNREAVLYRKTAPIGKSYFSSWYFGGVMEISSNNRYVLSYGFSRTESNLTLVDTETDRIWVLGESSNYDNVFSPEGYGSGTFSPDGNDLLLFGPSGIKINSLPDMTTKYSFNDSGLKCKYGNNNKEIVTCVDDLESREAFYWIIDKKQPAIIPFKENFPIWHASLSPDNNFLALATENGVQIWNVKKQQKVNPLRGGFPAHRVLYSHDGTRIAVDGQILLSSRGDTIALLEPVIDPPCEADRNVLDMAFSPDDSFLCAWQSGEGCAIFSVLNGKCIGKISGDNFSFLGNNIAVCDDSLYLVTMKGVKLIDQTPNESSITTYQAGLENYNKTTLWTDDRPIVIDSTQSSAFLIITYPDCQVDIIKKDGFREWMIPDKEWINPHRY